MNIESLREFIVFSRYLNFSKAALHLNLAQPTLSSHIANLEKELGFKLVVREQPVRLTMAGKRFCTDVKGILEDLDEAVSSCRQMSDNSGVITFEQPIRINGFGRAIDRLVLLFRKENPGIDVKWTSHKGTTLIDALAAGRVDGGFSATNMAAELDAEQSALVSLTPLPHIDPGEFYLWMHQSNPLCACESISVASLNGCSFLIPSSVAYLPLESLARAASEKFGIQISCSCWPGSYEECILNISPKEVMLVNDEERLEPAYAVVDNRCFKKVSGIEEFITPCFVSSASNRNPALRQFEEFLAKL
ncbi:LysR family transcriptional regulator [Adlercreutzia sp. ZJ473]|uniref:LysR family transcriptional regulator n=1 Tax=Adlercreutzia sp. ZJ473 TaxID=2722822 RepID=UPI00155623FE|nr:LysR family transcriptional regulator [Adlercreutzia sp. ZJ473]